MDSDPEMKPIPIYFFDASAIVKLVAREPGYDAVESLLSECGQVHSSWVVLAEVLGALKGKRRRGEVTDHEYGRAVYEFFQYVRSRRFHAMDLDVQDGRPVLLTHETEVFEHRKRYPKLDVADTLQMTVIRQSFLRWFAGDSRIKLVTAHADLAAAAESEGIPVVKV